jgi:hypothetical protein
MLAAEHWGLQAPSILMFHLHFSGRSASQPTRRQRSDVSSASSMRPAGVCGEQQVQGEMGSWTPGASGASEPQTDLNNPGKRFSFHGCSQADGTTFRCTSMSQATATSSQTPELTMGQCPLPESKAIARMSICVCSSTLGLLSVVP